MVFSVIRRQCSQKPAIKHLVLNAMIDKHFRFIMVHSIRITHASVNLASRLGMVAMVAAVALVGIRAYFISFH